MFRLSTKLPSRTARTLAACVSLSFINDVKQQGSIKLPIHAADEKSTGSPSGNTGVSASCTLNSHRNVGSCWQRRVPQWPGYRSPHEEVSSVC